MPVAAPDLELDQAYSTIDDSVADEMVGRLSHNHPHFCVDNAIVNQDYKHDDDKILYQQRGC